jgi:hypothetical protein|tara:strand:+ start:205 stop:354 length:150 start_codon:yes stop_codon:yes gene_type:complete
MDFRITLLADGLLFGFTYYSKGDIVIKDDEDWAELNLYLFIVKLTWRWF